MLILSLREIQEMESSPKKCEFLTEKFEITPNDLDEKLSFLIQHEFVGETGYDSQAEYSVDFDGDFAAGHSRPPGPLLGAGVF